MHLLHIIPVPSHQLSHWLHAGHRRSGHLTQASRDNGAQHRHDCARARRPEPAGAGGGALQVCARPAARPAGHRPCATRHPAAALRQTRRLPTVQHLISLEFPCQLPSQPMGACIAGSQHVVAQARRRARNLTTCISTPDSGVISCRRHSGPQGQVEPLTIIDDPAAWTAKDYPDLEQVPRKDFPLSGCVEVRYDDSEKRVMTDHTILSAWLTYVPPLYHLLTILRSVQPLVHERCSCSCRSACLCHHDWMGRQHPCTVRFGNAARVPAVTRRRR